MGGGGTMRSAAKIAGTGISVARSGFRGSPSTVATENFSRSQSTSRPTTPSRVTTSQGGKTAEPLHTAAATNLNEWEFADVGELVMEAGEPVPRVVFGEVPTFQEAKEATIELKDAIEKMYLSSSDSSQYEESFPGTEISVLPHTLFQPMNKSDVDAISNLSVPKHAIQAFELLSASAEVQTVVASIACDENVWKAVMQNPAVSSFFQSQQTVADFGEETNGKVVELTDDASVTSSEKVEESEFQSGIVFDFMGLLENLKLSVAEMVSRVSNYLQNIFPTGEKEKSSADADGNTKSNVLENIMGGSFMGLAMLVIMVVLVKRA